jgi:hypothetical protein
VTAKVRPEPNSVRDERRATTGPFGTLRTATTCPGRTCATRVPSAVLFDAWDGDGRATAVRFAVRGFAPATGSARTDKSPASETETRMATARAMRCATSFGSANHDRDLTDFRECGISSVAAAWPGATGRERVMGASGGDAGPWTNYAPFSCRSARGARLRECRSPNGSKHLVLTTPRVGSGAKMGGRHYALTLGGGPPRISATYSVEAGGKRYDALKLAQECMADWTAYLERIGLLA